MTTTIDKNQWCGQFKRCNGCKLQSEYMVKPEEMFPVMEDGKYVDKWAIRATAIIGAVTNITWLKIWLAPKLYLIEYAASLVK